MNPETHLFLSTPGGEVAELVGYLARDGFPADEAVFVTGPEHLGESLPEGRWTWLPANDELPPAPAGHLLIIADPGADPRPLIEELRGWLEENERPLGRIFTLIDCHRLSQTPPLARYYDLCIHFSDVILLGGRAEVSKKWIQEYQNSLAKRAIPATVTMLKKGGKVADLPALLFPEVRRLSQFFDPPEAELAPGIEIEGFAEGEDEAIDPRDPDQDPYLQRNEEGSYVVQLRV